MSLTIKLPPDDDMIFLLKENRIHITSPRIQVLKIIYAHRPHVFSAKTVLSFDASITRISVHRTLQLFVKKKILSHVPNTKRILEYRFNK
jgi:Fe2+ or Zn2+ uptake regulation protein